MTTTSETSASCEMACMPPRIHVTGCPNAPHPVPCPPGAVLCNLSDGDLITIHWSGQLRTVAVVITTIGVALRDLTEDEMAQLVEDATRYDTGEDR